MHLIPSCARARVWVRACMSVQRSFTSRGRGKTGVWTMANHWADEDLQRPNPSVVQRYRAYRMNTEWILSAFETFVIAVHLCSFNILIYSVTLVVQYQHSKSAELIKSCLLYIQFRQRAYNTLFYSEMLISKLFNLLRSSLSVSVSTLSPRRDVGCEQFYMKFLKGA